MDFLNWMLNWLLNALSDSDLNSQFEILIFKIAIKHDVKLPVAKIEKSFEKKLDTLESNELLQSMSCWALDECESNGFCWNLKREKHLLWRKTDENMTNQ